MPLSLTDIPELPKDEAFAITAEFNVDNHPDKVSLGAGVYRDENAKPWILPSVKAAKKILYETPALNHEYLPIYGSEPYLNASRDLILGDYDSSKTNVVSIQTISGTGANHLGAAFLAEQLKPKHVFISDPTWSNHHLLWEVGAPNVIQKTYPYYHAPTRSLDFKGMVDKLESEAEEQDVVILHACAHNPTGVDPTQEQWKTLAELFQRKKLFAFFDSAYQGFASGDVNADAWAVRHFQSTLFNSPGPQGMCVAQSFAKSFGLYGERVGALHLVLPSGTSPAGPKSQLVRLVRAEMSNCPLYGSRIVHTVLSDAKLTAMWKEDLKTMSGRVKKMRSLLKSEIEKDPATDDWSHLTSQIGMFSYTGLTEEHVKRLREVHHIYMMRNGRASLSGLNEGNVKYVADAIIDAIKHVSK